MNRIQLLSREIETQRLMLQMGIAPTAEIDHQTVRAMWRTLNIEQLRSRLSGEYKSTKLEPLPGEPSFFEGARAPGS